MINKRLEVAKRFVLLGSDIRIEDLSFHSSSGRETCFALIEWCRREMETSRIFVDSVLLGTQARPKVGKGEREGSCEVASAGSGSNRRVGGDGGDHGGHGDRGEGSTDDIHGSGDHRATSASRIITRDSRSSPLAVLRGAVNHRPRVLIAEFAGVRVDSIERGRVRRALAKLETFARCVMPHRTGAAATNPSTRII